MKLSIAIEIVYTYGIFVDKLEEKEMHLNIALNLLLK